MDMGEVLTIDDIESSTSRRAWLRWLVAGGGIGAIGWFLFGDVAARPRAVGVALDPNVDALAFDGDELVVEIAEDTDTDEWAIIHEYHEDSSNAIATGTVPEFGGEIRVPIVDAVAGDASEFPTDRFKFALYHVETDPETGMVDPRPASAVAFELPEA